MGYGLLRALPGETWLACHRLRHARPAQCEETPAMRASGPHDFAVRLTRTRQSRIQRPPHLDPRSWRSRSAPRVGWDAHIEQL